MLKNSTEAIENRVVTVCLAFFPLFSKKNSLRIFTPASIIFPFCALISKIVFFLKSFLLKLCVNTLHYTVIIHRHTAKVFAHPPSHIKPMAQKIGNYSPAYLTTKKYKHKRPKRTVL